jgi:peroxiredoxin
MAKLAINDKMPDFKFDTVYEKGKTVTEVIQNKKNTIFWVLRYIGCPTCRYDVHNMSIRYSEFTALDTQILVVMQSDPAVIRTALEDNKLPFDIICDPKMEIYDRFQISAAASKEARLPTTTEEIAKLEKKREQVKAAGFVHGKYEGNEYQLPALFVVQQDGTVAYAHYAKNSIDMPTIDDMLKVIKHLS